MQQPSPPIPLKETTTSPGPSRPAAGDSGETCATTSCIGATSTKFERKSSIHEFVSPMPSAVLASYGGRSMIVRFLSVPMREGCDAIASLRTSLLFSLRRRRVAQTDWRLR